MKISVLFTIPLLFGTTLATAEPAETKPPEWHARPSYIGPRDRFWRHHAQTKTLVVDGVDYYWPIHECLFDALKNEGALTASEAAQLDTLLETDVIPNRQVGQRIVDQKQERWGNTILVEVQQAMHPLQRRAIRRLAQCVRQNLPQYFEVRAMYLEFNLEEDPGLGGNTPTHLMPFLGIYLPSICDLIISTVRFAYDNAGWQAITIRDQLLGNLPATENQATPVNVGRNRAQAAIPMPEELGWRASEHLTYDDFPFLDAHHDGRDTAYTVNFALSGPDDYQGGYLYVVDSTGEKTFFKPTALSCVVFLGGHYFHGVTRISGGKREMFSNELWFNPDLPLGNTLWNSNGDNMDNYIRACNKAGHAAGQGPCPVDFSNKTSHGVSRQDILEHHDDLEKAKQDGAPLPPPLESDEEEDDGEEEEYNPDEDFDSEGEDDEDEEDEEDDDLDGEYWGPEDRYLPKFLQADLTQFYNVTEEPDFLVPKNLAPGQLMPIYWRDNMERIKDDEAYVIGLPPELLQEMTKYVQNNGMLELAKRLIYEHDTLPASEKFPFGQEHKLYTLEDGQTWGTMRPKWDGMDMIWIDPGDEECFESLVSVLRKGNFDIVLEAIAELFDLDGLMIQGIGPIFLSHFEHDPEYKQIHHDLIEAKGAFYNVIVPIYIPEGGAALYVGDDDRAKPVQMRYNRGIVQGAATKHGTGECDYRPNKDVRLSMAIYLADVNDENVEIIASDSTSLWPSQGDTHWFQAQQGRFWRRNDASYSMKRDAGRVPLRVKDLREDCAEQEELCIAEPDSFRLECPKTCEVYLDDEKYYKTLKSMVDGKYHDKKTRVTEESKPSCIGKDGNQPTCAATK